MAISARRWRFILAIVAVLSAFGSWAVSGGEVAASPGDVVPDQYIVVLRDDVANVPDVANEHARRHGATVQHVYQYALKGYAATIPAQRLAAIKADPRVVSVSEDRVLRAFGTVALASGDSAPTGVRRIGAATTTTVHQASTVGVAVIDTGIQLNHPDLNAVSGTNCVTAGASADDDNGHGTHVAGTIGARNNGSNVVGVAPGTKLYAVKVLDANGSGTNSQGICGIDWVTSTRTDSDPTNDISVANMSFGGPGSNDGNCGNTNTDPLHQAICRSTAAGVTYAAAAGNGDSSGNPVDFANTVPAAYPEVLTVTAMSDGDGLPGAKKSPFCFDVLFTQKDDSYATFSNYAGDATGQAHTIAGPGVCIKSDWKGSGTATYSGTSMATPHVTGTVALCFGNGSSVGPCAGLKRADGTPDTQAIIQRLIGDAQAHATTTNGFNGDPLRPVSGRYYGYLVWAGGY